MPKEKDTIFAVPGSLKIGSREFVIPAPTPTDLAWMRKRMKQQAKAKCLSPLQYANSEKENVDPITFVEAVKAAMAMGSGGGAVPTDDAIWEEYETLEGVRYQVWFMVHKLDESFTGDKVRDVVTEENYYEVFKEFEKAMGLVKLEKKA